MNTLTKVLETYNLQVISPDTDDMRWSQDDKRVLSNLPAMLEAVEEDLTELLPPGYKAVIKEWSSE